MKLEQYQINVSNESESDFKTYKVCIILSHTCKLIALALFVTAFLIRYWYITVILGILLLGISSIMRKRAYRVIKEYVYVYHDDELCVQSVDMDSHYTILSQIILSEAMYEHFSTASEQHIDNMYCTLSEGNVVLSYRNAKYLLKADKYLLAIITHKAKENL